MTVFPLNPRVGQRHYRADLDLDMEWDGLRWVSVHEVAAPSWLREAIQSPGVLLGRDDRTNVWVGALARRRRQHGRH